VPSFLRPYTRRLINAPVSHVTSFLILHEITAVVPLLGLFGLFHYSNWLPEAWKEGKTVREGVEKFSRYFRRKGWVAEDEDDTAGRSAKWTGEQGVRVVLEVAVAYAITKALLPARLILSVWATPWFARVFVLPLTGLFGMLFGRSGGKISASGTATEMGVMRKSGLGKREFKGKSAGS